MEIEFYDPEDATLYRLGKKSVVITSFVKKDRWKELKKKFRRVIPIFVRSKQDEENLKELIKDFSEKLEESIGESKRLSDIVSKMREEKDKIEEEKATKASLDIIKSITLDFPIEDSVCFDVDIDADAKAVEDALIKFCEKHNCYVLNVEDYSDWDYGGKRQRILNPDDFVKNVNPYEIFGRIFKRFCVINKDKFRKAVEEFERMKREAERRSVILGEALKELRNAVSVETWFDEERGEDVYEFRWNEDLVREIARKYGLSEDEIRELKDKVEDEIMFKEPPIYF